MAVLDGRGQTHKHRAQRQVTCEMKQQGPACNWDTGSSHSQTAAQQRQFCHALLAQITLCGHTLHCVSLLVIQNDAVKMHLLLPSKLFRT